MRHLFLFISAVLTLGLISCSDDDTVIDQTVNNTEGNVRFTLSAPDALNTRTVTFGDNSDSALGGITNCDMKKYDFRYQLAIFDEKGTVQYVNTLKEVVNEYSPVTFTVRLTPGHTYKAVAWADFVTHGTDTDLHYSTSDLTNITCLDAPDKQLNDESRDAYFITENITVDGVNSNAELVLRRPFAKVRVVTTDWKKNKLLPMPDYFKITYKNCKRFTSMNAVTGIASGDAIQSDQEVVYTSPVFNKDTKDYALSVDTEIYDRTLTVDYLMVNSEENPIKMRFQAFNSLDNNEKIIDKEIETNIPTKRNWLTTLLGNFFTTNFKVKVSCLEKFNDEWIESNPWWEPTKFDPVEPKKNAEGVYEIYNENEFVWLSNPANLKNGMNIKLMNDIDLNNVLFDPIGTGQENMRIDGQGHEIRNVRINFEKTVKKHVLFFDIDVPAEGAGVFGFLYQGSEVKNVNFKDVVINGLFSSDGHKKEYCKSAGCIGFIRGNVENCTAENIEINGGTSLLSQNNVGGLIGYYNLGVSNPHVSDCSVKHVLIHSDAQAGGLIGSIGDESTDENHSIGMEIKNCSADGVFIHNSYEGVTNSTSGNTVLSGGFSALVGGVVHGTGLTLTNCTATQDFNVYYDATPNTEYMNAMVATKAYDYQKKYLIGVCCHGAGNVVLKP